MWQKILVPIMFLGAQLIITWYGNFTGKIPSKGTYLGLSYDSVFIKSVIVQFQYIWVLVLLNILFSMGFSWGFLSYKNFLVLVFIWIASGPIAAFIFNAFVTKEAVDWPMIVGVILIVAGSVAVVGHKEILELVR